jgi:hypothetical protein
MLASMACVPHSSPTLFKSRHEADFDQAGSSVFVPDIPRKRPTAAGKDWDSMHPRIKRLYVDEKLTLMETIARMNNEGFTASWAQIPAWLVASVLTK